MKYDLPIEELKAYLPVRTEPDDFDNFWKETLLMRVAFH
jgi:cephalosporin-C deacetylase